jgi:hypothetical protein
MKKFLITALSISGSMAISSSLAVDQVVALCPKLNLTTLPTVVCSTKDTPMTVTDSPIKVETIYNTVKDTSCVGSVGTTNIRKGLQSLFKGAKDYNADPTKSRVIQKPKAQCRYLYPKDWNTPALWGKATLTSTSGFMIEGDITDAIFYNIPAAELCPSIGIQEFASLVNTGSFKDKRSSKAEFIWTAPDKGFFPEKVDASKITSLSTITKGSYGHKSTLQMNCVYTYKPGGTVTDVTTMYEVIYNPFK